MAIVLCTGGLATPFQVAFNPLDVASQRQVSSVNLNLVTLIGLGRTLCTSVMCNQGYVTMVILLDRGSVIMATRIFLWCCPLPLVRTALGSVRGNPRMKFILRSS